jgi:molybdopterin-guanine dinucleotide biosynthesis protein A
MRRDKAGLTLDGNTFLEIALEKAQKISQDVVVSFGDESQVKDGLENVTIVIDDVRNRGPLYGLMSSLKKCKENFTAVLPIDAPLLTAGIYSLMAREVEGEPGLEAVVPSGLYGPEPLFGVYQTRAFLSACKNTIKRGDESVMKAVESLKIVKYIDLEAFKPIDPKLLSFQNINTPLDLELLMEKIDDKTRT